jgi:hypothetical protein
MSIIWKPIDESAKTGRKVLVWYKSPFPFADSFACQATFKIAPRGHVFGWTALWLLEDGNDGRELDPKFVTHYSEINEPALGGSTT